jgi:hypothetical protein
MKKSFLPALGILSTALAAAMVWANVAQVVEASPCQDIFWDNFQPTCVVAESNRTFSFQLYTSTLSDFNASSFDYFLNVAFTPANSPDIEGGDITPGYWEVYETGAFGPDSCTGTLKQNKTQGNFQISSYDSPHVNCAEVKDVTIKESGQSC